jgi:hypothetical protein
VSEPPKPKEPHNPCILNHALGLVPRNLETDPREYSPSARKLASGSRVEHPRETVYSPGMCSSPTWPDGVSHKAHVLSIKTSRPGLHAGTSRSEGFSHPANITTRSWEKMEDPSAMIQEVFIYSKQ